MKFSKQLMKDIAHDDYDSDVVKVMEREFVQKSRWEDVYSVIFQCKEDGNYYQSSYRLGATERQESQPYDCEGDEIECAEVHQVETIVKVWEEK